MEKIKVIDLFAGPGGLGEGFSSFQHQGENPFKTSISIEMEASAHRTLTLRSFYRQFGQDTPEEYYQFLRGELGKTPEDQLYKIKRFAKQVSRAQKEARCLTLGEDNTIINAAIHEAVGTDECILIGGPPCQAYSVAGRARNCGKIGYKAEEDHRSFLYLEYLKVIARFQPKLFIMENVRGMLSAKINGEPIFNGIREDLHNPCKATKTQPDRGRKRHNYHVVSLVVPSSKCDISNKFAEDTDPRDYLIKTEDFGIPQRRHRVILLGLREDILGQWNNNLILKPYVTQVTTSEVISDLPKLRSGLSRGINTDQEWLKVLRASKRNLSSTLRNSGLLEVAQCVENTIDNLSKFQHQQGANFCVEKSVAMSVQNNKKLEAWYTDKRLGNFVVNHESKAHMEADLQRYLFCSTWAQVDYKNKWNNPNPKPNNYPQSLKPKHKNFNSGNFVDRFRVQPANSPATTITSHIAKDGHYFIHPDPLQCRTFTVREAARIQTFPDNYFFVGNKTQQYVQVGNAVPPYLAYQLAKIVHQILN